MARMIMETQDALDSPEIQYNIVFPYTSLFGAYDFQTNQTQRFFNLATLRFIRQYEEFTGGNIMLNRIRGL